MHVHLSSRASAGMPITVIPANLAQREGSLLLGFTDADHHVLLHARGKGSKSNASLSARVA